MNEEQSGMTDEEKIPVKKEEGQTNKLSKLLKSMELLPIIIALILVPLVMRMKEIHIDQSYYRVWTTQHMYMDFFSYYKMVVLLWCTLFALLLLINRFVMEKGMDIEKKGLYYKLTLFYAMLVSVSTITSQYVEVAYWGFLDRHEGLLTIIAYVFMFVYTFYIVDSIKDVKRIFIGLMIGASGILIIGVFQYFGFDFIKSQIGRMLVVPSEFKDLRDKLQFSFGKGVIYATLFHYNYVGSYISIILPIFFTLALFTKELKFKIVYSVFAVMSAIVWLGCNARSGIIGVGFALFILLLIVRKKLFSNKKILLNTIIAFVISTAVIGYIVRDAIVARYNATIIQIESTEDIKKNLPLKELKATDKELRIVARENPLLVRIEKDASINFYEEATGKKILYTFDPQNGMIELQTPEYKDYSIKAVKVEGENKNDKGSDILIINRESIKVYARVKDQKIALINNGGMLLSDKPVEKIGFEGWEKIGSARGYIWSRTLPLIKYNLIWGNGPDTYVFYFPQHDVIGKLVAYSAMWMCVDKPHNFYLQQAVNTGLLSLVLLLAIFVAYFIESYKLYINSDLQITNNVYGLGCFLGVCGYLAAAIFNDSIIGVAPVFWMVLGLGVAINRIIIKEKQKLSTGEGTVCE